MNRKLVIRDRIIQYDLFKQIHADIDKRKGDTRRANESQGLIINGATGAGKSTLLKTYAINQCAGREERQNEHGDVITNRPVFYTTCPGEVTVRSMVERMLREIGDPAWSKGKLSEQEQRLNEYLNDCQVEVVIIDDFHLLLTAGKTSTDFIKCTRWLQTLVKGCEEITFIVVGVDVEIDTVMESSRQLHRHFKRKELKPFGFRKKQQIKRFNGLVASFEKTHGVRYGGDKSERLSFIRQVHKATQGYVGFVAYLFDEVVNFVNDDEIDPNNVPLSTFAKAFDERLIDLIKVKSNPFKS